jgi:hypothetical protein
MSNNLIPEATYKAAGVPMQFEDGSASYVQFRRVGKNETPQVRMLFEVLEGAQVGRKVFWQGWLTEAAYERTIQALRACGFQGDDLEGALTQGLSNEVEIVTEITEGNDGKQYAGVRWVNQISSRIKVQNAMDANDLRNFSAIMRAKVGRIPTVDGRKVERPKRQGQSAARNTEEKVGKLAGSPAGGNGGPPPPSDDDCPF